MKYIISTLGCKVNQYETQAMETILQQRGFEAAAPGEIADVVIVNTCAVTAESGRKSRQTIRRLRDENPGAVVAVCGCYSQHAPEAVRELGIDVIGGSGSRAEFVEMMVAAVAERAHLEKVDNMYVHLYKHIQRTTDNTIQCTNAIVVDSILNNSIITGRGLTANQYKTINHIISSYDILHILLLAFLLLYLYPFF